MSNFLTLICRVFNKFKVNPTDQYEIILVTKLDKYSCSIFYDILYPC